MYESQIAKDFLVGRRRPLVIAAAGQFSRISSVVIECDRRRSVGKHWVDIKLELFNGTHVGESTIKRGID